MGLLNKLRNAVGAKKAGTSVTSGPSAPAKKPDGTETAEAAGTAEPETPAKKPESEIPTGVHDAGDAAAFAAMAAKQVMRPKMTPHVAAVADLGFGAVNPF